MLVKYSALHSSTIAWSGLLPRSSLPSNKGCHKQDREVGIHHQPGKIVTNSKPNSYLVWNGMAWRFGPMEYSPCKTARNNVFSPKPPLFKTNDKMTLGGIWGSSELCLPDSQVSQPHNATTITTAPPLFNVIDPVEIKFHIRQIFFIQLFNPFLYSVA